MDDMKTLKEIYNSLGVTRRAIQGYEAAGLVAPTSTNKYGYLLYGEAEQQRIKKIKLYQQLGFTIKEIKVIIDAPNDVVKKALEEKLVELKKENVKIHALIEEARKLIKELE